MSHIRRARYNGFYEWTIVFHAYTRAALFMKWWTCCYVIFHKNTLQYNSSIVCVCALHVGWHWCGFINEIGKWLVYCCCYSPANWYSDGPGVYGKYFIINDNNTQSYWGSVAAAAAHALVKYVLISIKVYNNTLENHWVYFMLSLLLMVLEKLCWCTGITHLKIIRVNVSRSPKTSSGECFLPL